MINGIVYTNTEKCEACSACLQVCQTKSIRINEGKAEIIKESCLNCGLCIDACSKKAKEYLSGIAAVEKLLNNKKTAMVLAPSYVIVAVKKYRCTPGQFCSALKKLGFTYVYESSFAADLVTKVYINYLNEQIKTKGKENTHVITSPCPSLMNYIEKHVPELINEFAPVLSPMAAQAVLAKHWIGSDLAVVGGSPCIAKKTELLDPKLGLFEESLTFAEIIQLIDKRGIVPSSLGETEFDGIQAFYGAGFPISGGLAKTLELFPNHLEINPISNDILIIEGEDRSIEFLKHMAQQKRKDANLKGYPLLIDILYCEGCILGKAMGVENDFLEHKRIVSEYTQKRFDKIEKQGIFKKHKGYQVLTKNTMDAPEFTRWLKLVEQLIKDNKFFTTWNDRRYSKRIPSDRQLIEILAQDGKYKLEDQLNCRACGYHTCRDRAVAVFNGENEPGGCIVYQKHEAERLYQEANKTNSMLFENTEALIATINEIVEGNQSSAATSTKLLDNVENQNDEIIQLNDKIVELVKTFNYVSEMATSIASIADQTKMLSLNAQIEAARAGDAGRGFAVVAEEVGKLSEHTHEKVKAVNGFYKEIVKIQKELNHLTQLLIQESQQVGQLATSQAAVSQQIAAASEELFAATENLKTLIK